MICTEAKSASSSVFAAAVPSRFVASRLLLCQVLQIKLSQESPSVPQLTLGNQILAQKTWYSHARPVHLLPTIFLTSHCCDSECAAFLRPEARLGRDEGAIG